MREASSDQRKMAELILRGMQTKHDGQFGHVADDRHWSTKKLEDMTERDWRIFREDNLIQVRGFNAPLPMRMWDEGLPADLLTSVKEVGYLKPTPVQMACIPAGLLFRDVVGIAETGSGKTAAFVLPLLAYVCQMPPMTEETALDGPYALVLAPTHELAQQIEAEIQKFAKPLGRTSMALVGGQDIHEQSQAFRKGVDVIVATPGRLVDVLERRYVVLNQCNFLVMDEVCAFLRAPAFLILT